MIWLLISVVIQFQAQQKSVDLTKIVGKTRNEVEKQLGKPDKNNTSNIGTECECQKISYLKGQLSIIYGVDGKPDWISVSQNINLVNLNVVRIRVYHKSAPMALIKVSSMEKPRCCLIN